LSQSHKAYKSQLFLSHMRLLPALLADIDVSLPHEYRARCTTALLCAIDPTYLSLHMETQRALMAAPFVLRDDIAKACTEDISGWVQRTMVGYSLRLCELARKEDAQYRQEYGEGYEIIKKEFVDQLRSFTSSQPSPHPSRTSR
jgi:hypothetical protein